jgi:hypothetical protein
MVRIEGGYANGSPDGRPEDLIDGETVHNLAGQPEGETFEKQEEQSGRKDGKG